MAQEQKSFELEKHPTPEERAEFVILKLEKFIRDGRKDDSGMPFRKWQAMAKSEIIMAIIEAENRCELQIDNSKRVLFICSASLVTIGFWGMIINLNKIDYLIGALIIGIAGFIGLIALGGGHIKGWYERRKALNRRNIFIRVTRLNNRIKRLERELEIEAGELEHLLSKVINVRN